MTLSLNIPVTGLTVPYSFLLLYLLMFHSVFTQLRLKSDTSFQIMRATTHSVGLSCALDLVRIFLLCPQCPRLIPLKSPVDSPVYSADQPVLLTVSMVPWVLQLPSQTDISSQNIPNVSFSLDLETARPPLILGSVLLDNYCRCLNYDLNVTYSSRLSLPLLFHYNFFTPPPHPWINVQLNRKTLFISLRH